MLPVCSSVFYDVTQQDVLGSNVQFAAARMGVGHVKKQLIVEGSWVRLGNASTSRPRMETCGESDSDFV